MTISGEHPYMISVLYLSTDSKPICGYFGHIFDGVGERRHLEATTDPVAQVCVRKDAKFL